MGKQILLGLVCSLFATTSLAAPAASCTATAFSQVATAVAGCTDIVLNNIAVPAGSQLDLTKVKPSTTVTFKGTTVRISTSRHLRSLILFDRLLASRLGLVH